MFIYMYILLEFKYVGDDVIRIKLFKIVFIY